MNDVLVVIFGLGWAICLFSIQYRHAGSIKRIFFHMYYRENYFKEKIDRTDKKLLIFAAIFFVIFIILVIRTI